MGNEFHCKPCSQSLPKNEKEKSLAQLLDSIEVPLLLMQPDPRQVVTANKKAAELFGKDRSAMEGRRGGQVFDCLHSFSEAGCGKDPHCEDCPIKNAVVETFATGKPLSHVAAVLEIRKEGTILPYDVVVSTEKAGDLAYLKIERYRRKRG